MSTDNKKYNLSSLIMVSVFSLILGGLLYYFLTPLLDSKTESKKTDGPEIDSVSFDKMGLGRIKKSKDIQARFGGPTTGKHAQDLTFNYSTFLKDHVPDNTEFTTAYSAATWYTAEELANYIDTIVKKGAPTSAKDIRIYFCPGIYSNFSKNPYTNKDVSFRITSCLVALKSPYGLINSRTGAINIENNPNSLGVYNWGDLEP